MFWKVVLTAVLVAVFVYLYVRSNKKAAQTQRERSSQREEKKNAKRDEYRQSEAKRIRSLIADTKSTGLQAISTDFILTKDEVCYIDESATSKGPGDSRIPCKFYLTSQRVVISAVQDIGLSAPLSDISRYGTEEISVTENNYDVFFATTIEKHRVSIPKRSVDEEIEEELQKERKKVTRALHIQIAHRHYTLLYLHEADRLAAIIGMALEKNADLPSASIGKQIHS